MKFICSRDYLLSVLNQIAKAVAIKPSTPALGGIYLKIGNGELEIQSNNYMLGMSSKIVVTSAIEGEVVVIGKKFLDVVRALPDGMISVSREFDSGYLEISCGKSSYKIATFKVDEFPKVTKTNSENSFAIEADLLKMLINKTVFACAKEEKYPIYTGCLFEIKDDEITVAATNMHRLAVSQCELVRSSNEMRFVVPGDILRIISEMLPDDSSAITIDYFGKNVSFEIGEVFVKARLIDGTYPEYQRVIPVAGTTFVYVNVMDLLGAVDRLSVISREDPNKKITFKIKRGEIEICAASAEVGNGVETVRARLDGDEINISFNGNYIAEALRVLREGDCKISLKGEFDAADIRPNDDRNFIYVVTPIRT